MEEQILTATEETEKEENEATQEVIADEQSTETADGFSCETTFEGITETTPEDLKAQGYITVIKKFMAGIGKSCIGDALTEGRLSAVISDAEKYGINGILYTPFFMATADAFFKKNATSLKKIVAVDYPFGESSFDAKTGECLSCNKSFADSVALTFPAVAERTGVSEDVKKQTVKIFKKVKKQFGVIIDGNIPYEEIKATFDLFADTPFAFFTLFINGKEDKDLYALVKLAGVCKKDKKLVVCTDIKDPATARVIFNAGADLIYTSHAEDIARSLVDMAGIKL